MQDSLPFAADKGLSVPRVRVDLEAGCIAPANPRSVGWLLATARNPNRPEGMAGTWIVDSLLLAKRAELLARASRDPWLVGNADLCRIVAATEFVGKVFGGDLSVRVPNLIRSVVDQYHATCRANVRRQLGLFEPAEAMRSVLSVARTAHETMLFRAEPVDAKLLPRHPRTSRLVSAFVQLFRVDRGRPTVLADTTKFVVDPSEASVSVDLSTLSKSGSAVVVQIRKGGR